MSLLSSADHVSPFGKARNDAIIFGFPFGSDAEYSPASSFTFRTHQYARYSPSWENAGTPCLLHFGLFGICLVSNVSVERRYIPMSSPSSANCSAKAIHLPSGDQGDSGEPSPTPKHSG